MGVNYPYTLHSHCDRPSHYISHIKSDESRNNILIDLTGSLDAPFQSEGGQKPEPQVSGLNFVKFANKVANLSKLGQPKSPTSPTPSTGEKMNF